LLQPFSINNTSRFAANAHQLHWMASHWMLCRLRLPAAQLSATHDNLCVATLLRYGCHRLTMICASLTLLQIMFAGATCVRCCDSSSLATPKGEVRHIPAALSIGIPHPRGEHSGRALKGRRFYVQKKRQLGPGSEVLCRTSAFGKGSLLLRHLHVICAESSGSQQRRSRYGKVSFLGKEVAAKQTEVS
jgi:hypothetical protein